MAAQTHSRIGVMINNAGVMPSSPLERLRTDEWNQMIDVTVASTLGEPDAGLASYRDMVERVRTFCDKSDNPMICDANTGSVAY
jgi:NADP-dependent 3-hydroxy acid dehydrogenase YdfG